MEVTTHMLIILLLFPSYEVMSSNEKATRIEPMHRGNDHDHITGEQR